MKLEFNPAAYWDRRYREGRTSGAGSEGAEGAYKAAYLSRFIAEHDVRTTVDWGCGDGQVLSLVELGTVQYTGVDVSQTIIERMSARFPHHSFVGPHTAAHNWRDAYDVALSFDVLFHFPDDTDYFAYLDHVFQSATKYVIIYSSNDDTGRTARHVYRRKFTPDVAERFPHWKLVAEEPPLQEGLASFFVYERVT